MVGELKRVVTVYTMCLIWCFIINIANSTADYGFNMNVASWKESAAHFASWKNTYLWLDFSMHSFSWWWLDTLYRIYIVLSSCRILLLKMLELYRSRYRFEDSRTKLSEERDSAILIYLSAVAWYTASVRELICMQKWIVKHIRKSSVAVVSWTLQSR